MTIALREIIRLWFRQKRHNFHWQELFLTVYFTVLYVGMVVAFYLSFKEQMDAHPLPDNFLAFLPLAAVGVQFGDLLMKLFWRRSPVEMDDYLRTRPVSPRDWSNFVLLETSQGFLQWMIALAVGFVGAFVLPWWAVVLLIILIFTVSLTNALFQNCWRRAPGNEWTLPLVFGYLVWTGLMWALCFVGFLFEFGAWPLLLLLNIGVDYVLQRYFTGMKNHNEEMHVVASTTVHSLGQVSVWSIEWVQLLRSKRLRVSFLFIAAIFLLNTYMQQQTTIQEDFNGVNIMLLFGIAFPSLILAQWVLGIEANFFAGIWTKPWPVEGILRRKYVFFCALCGVMAILILPCVLFLGLSPWIWFVTILFGCGCFILPFMATCMFSSRMDLFTSAFFNYQGGNKQLNFFSFIMFVPIAIYYAAYFLLPMMWAHLLIGGLGLLGLLLHRPYIHWVAKLWHRRRYEIMERWQNE